MSFHDRFWRLVRVGEPDECWPWRGYDHNRYQVYRNASGRQESVHRIAYRLANGPIPRRLEVHHTCENKCCCNPRHLEALTRAEHQARHALQRRGRRNAKRSVPRGAKWKADPVLGCWLWQGATASDYPVMTHNGKTRLVRRVLWEEQHGSIGKDIILRSTCKRTLCVNPAHLTPMPRAVAVKLPRRRRAPLRASRTGATSA